MSNLDRPAERLVAFAEVPGRPGLAFTEPPCRWAGSDGGPKDYPWRLLPTAPRHAAAAATTLRGQRAVLSAQGRGREIFRVRRATGPAPGKGNSTEAKRVSDWKGAQVDA